MTPDEAKELLKFPDNCTAQINPVGKDCYRVNIYEKHTTSDCVVPHTRMARSAYVCLTKDGYKDFTLSK